MGEVLECVVLGDLMHTYVHAAFEFQLSLNREFENRLFCLVVVGDIRS